MLLTIDQRSDYLNNFRATLSLLVYPIQSLVNLTTHIQESLIETMLAYEDLQAINKQLKQQLLTTKIELLKFAALEKENIRLHALLENTFELGEQFLIAKLLSVKLESFKHIVVVNKGTRFDVHPKQAVLDVNGVVGQITHAMPFSSEIMMITDANHTIPVQVNRNGLYTIALGSGQLNRLILPFLPNNADIKPGDLLITSGLGEVFPHGYPVAIVESVVLQPDKPFATIYATPEAKLDRNRELLIVWSESTPIPFFPLLVPENHQSRDDNDTRD